MKSLSLKTLSALFAAVVLLFMGCTATNTTTAKVQKDTSWMFHDIVDVNFVKQYVKMPKPENVMLIDSRPKKAKFDKGYIPTAVNIPDSQFAKMTDQLPKDKDALLIFYCQGPS